MEKNGGGGGGAPATGCYKCGRPGHWSRDCPFSNKTDSNSSTTPNPNPSFSNFSRSSFKNSNFPSKFPFPIEKPIEKPKKLPRTRPKLTPELLLSEDGLGYVLKHFPKSFKFRGRGHEVSDLGNLIELYTQWHSQLIPYYSFQQFMQKVEQVAATKRVRACIRDLKERVANGGDPSKLHEPPVEHDVPSMEPVVEEVRSEDPVSDLGNPPPESHDADALDEEMADEIYRNATEEPCLSSQNQTPAVQVLPDHSIVNGPPDQLPDNQTSILSDVITEEQKTRMEANRLKALERASARVRSSHTD
ncbi:zinc knuckle (CCHC-type) family protein [Thalictrum thalictroides]|uniref:Zinc knuckle (CCHC-type) family protein n=1 Tax=Thalictrum thalictroides TaxID=46969 RepID=A0A7J6UU30_THATH|nr:zinc knuckle (CCHC-type) family protein [Thalictrum thalictroides]